MSTQIDNLRAQFDMIPTAEKGRFINDLQGKLPRFQGSQHAEYSAFLNECMQKHNAELRGGPQPRPHAPPVQQKAYSQPPAAGAPVQYQQPIQYQTPPQGYQQPNQTYSPNTQYANNLKVSPKVISVILAVLIVITMLLSWFTFSIPLSALGASANIGLSDIRVSATVFEIADIFGQVNEFMQSTMKMMGTLLGALGDDFFPSEIMDVTSGVESAAIVMGAVSVLVVLSIIALLVFIYMIMSDKKHAVRLGQFGSILAAMAAIIFAIVIEVINSNISNALNDAGAMLGSFGAAAFSGSMFQLSCTIWVLFAMAIGASNAIFITYNTKKLISTL